MQNQRKYRCMEEVQRISEKKEEPNMWEADREVQCVTTQKRYKVQCDKYDALLIHLDTVFLSEEKVKEMERHVLQLRPGPHGQVRKFVNKTNRGKNVDKCEERLLIPNSILDICQNSFLAADKKREKAGTQFFKDTGLMALLCWHDQVLFLINMITADEKQYYAFVLL